MRRAVNVVETVVFTDIQITFIYGYHPEILVLLLPSAPYKLF